MLTSSDYLASAASTLTKNPSCVTASCRFQIRLWPQPNCVGTTAQATNISQQQTTHTEGLGQIGGNISGILATFKNPVSRGQGQAFGRIIDPLWRLDACSFNSLNRSRTIPDEAFRLPAAQRLGCKECEPLT